MGQQADSIKGYKSMASHTRHKESYRGGWVKLTPEEVKWYSAEGKQTIKEKVDKIIERYMKPSVVRSRGGRAGFGEVQDLYTKWHGDNLILIAKRRGGRGPGGYSASSSRIRPASSTIRRYTSAPGETDFRPVRLSDHSHT